MPLAESDTIQFPYPLTKTTEDKSTTRPGISPPTMHELVGVEGLTQGGLRVMNGMQRVYDLRYYSVPADAIATVPNTLHDQDSKINDFFPVNFAIGASGYAYGFVYRAVRSNPVDGLADVFIDLWNSKTDTTTFGTSGFCIMQGCAVDEQMDVQVFGRFVYVFIRGRSPAVFYVTEEMTREYFTTLDTWMEEADGDHAPNDTKLVLELDATSGVRKRGLIRFDCSEATGKTATKATLRLQREFAGSAKYELLASRVTQAWTKDANWLRFDGVGGTLWTAPGGDVNVTGRGEVDLNASTLGLIDVGIGVPAVDGDPLVADNPVQFALDGTGEVNLLIHEENTAGDTERTVTSDQGLNPLSHARLTLEFSVGFYTNVVIGKTPTGPLPGPGLQPQLEGPQEAGTLGSFTPEKLDDDRAGEGQINVSTLSPTESELFPDILTGLCLTEPEFGLPGGNGPIPTTCPQFLEQGDVTGNPDYEILGAGIPINFAHIIPESALWTSDPTRNDGLLVMVMIGWGGPLQNEPIAAGCLYHAGAGAPFQQLDLVEVITLDNPPDNPNAATLAVYVLPSALPVGDFTGDATLSLVVGGTPVHWRVVVMPIVGLDAENAVHTVSSEIDLNANDMIPSITLQTLVAGKKVIGIHMFSGIAPGNVPNPGQAIYTQTKVYDGKDCPLPPTCYSYHIQEICLGDPNFVSLGFTNTGDVNRQDFLSIAISLSGTGLGQGGGCPLTSAEAYDAEGFRVGGGGSSDPTETIGLGIQWVRPPTPLQGGLVPRNKCDFKWTKAKLFDNDANGPNDLCDINHWSHPPVDGPFHLVLQVLKWDVASSSWLEQPEVVLPVDATEFDFVNGGDVADGETHPGFGEDGELPPATRFVVWPRVRLTVEGCGVYEVIWTLGCAQGQGYPGGTPIQFTSAGGPQPNARKFTKGDYTFAYVLMDSATGRRSALSEIAQVREGFFDGIEGQLPSVGGDFLNVPQFWIAMEIVYDSAEFDIALIFRSINTSEGGGFYAASFLFLDNIVYLNDYHTCKNDVDEDFAESVGTKRQAIYYYTLEDKQLIYQSSYVDRATFDARMPFGGAALTYENTMLVSRISENPDSTSDGLTEADFNKGIGEMRWSKLTEPSVEMFSPLSRYVPDLISNEMLVMKKVGGNAVGFSRDRLYHIRRHQVYITVQEMHEGLGIVNHRAVDAGGAMLYFVTEKGLKAIDARGRVDDIMNLNSLLLRDWAGSLTEHMHVAYDPAMGVLFLHNSSYMRTAMLWFPTSMVTELDDMHFSYMRQGAWPTSFKEVSTIVRPFTSDDYDNTLTERALFLQQPKDFLANAAILGTTNRHYRPRVYMVDHGRAKLTGTTLDTGAPGLTNPGRRVATLDGSGDLTGWVVTAKDLGAQTVTATLTDGNEPMGMDGAVVYMTDCAVDESEGKGFQIIGLVFSAGTPNTIVMHLSSYWSTFIHGAPSILSIGDKLQISPVPVRVVGANLAVVDPDTGMPTQDHSRQRILSSIGGVFADCQGRSAANGRGDNTFYGAIYEGTIITKSVTFGDDNSIARSVSTDDAGLPYSGVENGESRFYAGMGATTDTEGKYGVMGATISPSIEIICPDLDFVLLEMLVRGKILGTERGAIGRTT